MTTGTLRICGTPIGNLGDVTQRLRETLADAAVIACEDTRRTRALLTALGIPAPKLERLDANTEERGAGAARRAAPAAATTSPSSPMPGCPPCPTPAPGWCSPRRPPASWSR